MYGDKGNYYINNIKKNFKLCPTVASHLKGVQKSTTTNQIRKALCEYKTYHPTCARKDLQQWLNDKYQARKILEKVIYEWFLQY